MHSDRAEDKPRGDALRLALLGHAHRNSLATMAVQAAAAIGVTLISRAEERPFHVA